MRALQTNDMLHIKTGVLLLGPAACGKSTVIKVLQAALFALDMQTGNTPLQSTYIFPKAVSPLHLYGNYNSATQVRTGRGGGLGGMVRRGGGEEAQPGPGRGGLWQAEHVPVCGCHMLD